MIRAYARVSTEEQDLSLQLDAFNREGVDVVYHEKESSRNQRPELERMLTELEKGDTVIVWSLDRLGRETIELLETLKQITDAGAAFRSLTQPLDNTDSPEGKLIAGMFACQAEYSRAILRRRTVAGIAAARARGSVIGRPRALSETQELVALEMIDKGESSAHIARVLGCSRPTISRLKKRRGEG